MPFSVGNISFVSINIQECTDVHVARLCNFLETEVPDIVMLQETWLDDSVADIPIPGYALVCRRDRTDGPKRGYGGIAIYRKISFNSIAHLENSLMAERSWCTVMSDIGPILLGNWYRPRDADPKAIESLQPEVEQIGRASCRERV